MRNLLIATLAITLITFIAYHRKTASSPIATHGTVESKGDAAIGGTFSLTNQHGQPIADTDFTGKYRLVFFGFTHCPEICPTQLFTISETLKQLPNVSLASIFITLDPERDTVAQLYNYGANFNPNIHLLTGSLEDIETVAKKFKIYHQKVDMADGYMINHSSLFYLLDPNGKYITHYPYNITVNALTASLKQAINE